MEVTTGETWCGLMSCGHPGCWRAQRVVRRGQTSKRSTGSSIASDSPRSSSSELPTQKVHNILNEAFGSHMSMDARSESPLSCESAPPGPVFVQERVNPLMEYLKMRRRRHSSQPQPPQVSPSDGLITQRTQMSRKMQMLEVQEVFDIAELQPDEWSQHFSARPYYVWIPNPHKRRSIIPRMPSDQAGPTVPLPTRDVTEELLPRDPEKDIRSAESQKRALKTSPYSAKLSRFFRSARQASNGVVTLPDRRALSCTEMRHLFTVDDKNVLNLLDLPPNILSEVLDQIEKGELMTKERLDDLMRQASSVQRPDSRPAFVSAADLLQQRRAKLHMDSRERNMRQPGRHQSRQVYQMDDDLLPTDSALSRSRPLPPIAPPGDARSPSVQCVSVDMPAPAPSVSQSRGPSSRARPFTYTRDVQLDLMLAPIQSPPVTQRTETPRTENDSASLHVAASTDRSTLANEVLPVPHYQPLPVRSAGSSAQSSSAHRRELSARSSEEGIPAGAVPPSTTPKTLAPHSNKEDVGMLGTIPESHGEYVEPQATPQPRSATVGRVTFEEGVIAVPPESPRPEEPVAREASRAEELRSPSESGHWTQQASPELWPANLAPQPVSAGGDLDRPVSSSSTAITIPVANIRQAKSAPARGQVPPEEILPGGQTSGEGAGVEDETPLPPPPSPEPLPSTQSLEPAERADSLRVHSGGPAAMSPITESTEFCEREEDEQTTARISDRDVHPTPNASTINDNGLREGVDVEKLQD